jgi:MotA/TolQ/ExbB proton channel family
VTLRRVSTRLPILKNLGDIGRHGMGYIHALGAIAVGGQALVNKVAGPVGEALIMTAFG